MFLITSMGMVNLLFKSIYSKDHVWKRQLITQKALILNVYLFNPDVLFVLISSNLRKFQG